MTPWIWGTVRLSTTAPQKPQNGSTAGRSTINQKGDKDLKIIEVKDRTQPLIEQLLKVWESSVKATHLFLSEDEIENIKKYVPQALKEIPYLIIIENEDKIPVGFMGIVEQNPLAKGFYEHMGFEVYKRTERDEQGDPYPLLYMRLV